MLYGFSLTMQISVASQHDFRSYVQMSHSASPSKSNPCSYEAGGLRLRMVAKTCTHINLGLENTILLCKK